MKVAAVVLFSILGAVCLATDQKKEEKPKPPQSIAELQQQLEKILKDTHTPGMSVAIVHREGPEWIAGLGTADVASSRPATADTLFRIGSTSKAFAALAILMLVDQGKLSLDDPVHKLAPEVWFENRWEAKDPVRVVHLLEHTTGWEDMHLREFAKDWPSTKGLGEALDYDHHSRISRWHPGTRWAYSSSGPAVAAYIVEKITGQKFEDFVEQNLFHPIGMRTATYYEPAPEAITTLYGDDGKTPSPYWNLLFRPAGSINASAKDMAAYIQFYLNRGAVNGKQVVPAADIDRMESPTSTWAAKDGRKLGYGLCNFWNVQDGFVYHGHAGSVGNGQTWINYMPDYGVGYFFSINSGNGGAFFEADKAIRDYVTRKLEKPALPAVASLSPHAAEYSGWYESDSPQFEFLHFLDRLALLSWIRFKDNKLLIANLGGWNEAFLPVTDTQFRHVPKSKDDLPDPVATAVLLTPNAEGRFIDLGVTMKKIPGWFAIGEILTVAYVILCLISVLVYAPFWILGGLSKRRRRPAERGIRSWPVAAVISLVASVGICIMSTNDLIGRLGHATPWSVGLFLLTIAFAVASLASAISLWRAPAKGVRRGVRRFSTAVTVALLIATAYLAYWGIIGLRTWA